MKSFIRTLNKFLTPTLIIGYLILCISLLAAAPEGKGGLLLAILWGAVTAAAFRWGTWGILLLAKKKANPKELLFLTRTVEILMLLLTAGALAFAILLREIPSVWIFFPTPLFALQGALRFDAEG